MRPVANFVVLLLMLSSIATGADIYIAQNPSGADSGQDCANAHSASWFNSASNWARPKASGKIGPGDIAHLCGTFTFPANTTGLTIRNAGSPGSPITILFEPGAILQSPQFASYAAPGGGILCNRYNGCSSIVIDGGTNGVIQNTSNGSGDVVAMTRGYPVEATEKDQRLCPDGNTCTYHAPSTGITITGYPAGGQSASNIEVKNLTIRNIYVSNSPEGYGMDLDGMNSRGITFRSPADHISIHDNHVSGAYYLISGEFNNASSDIEIYRNTLRDASSHIGYGASGASAQATSVKIHDNDISDWQYWQCPADSATYCPNHHEHIMCAQGIITYTGQDSPTAYVPEIYNNYIHGDLGRGGSTAHIFCTVIPVTGGTYASTHCVIYNNLLVDTSSTVHTPIWVNPHTSDTEIYNNTIAFYTAGGRASGCYISNSDAGGERFKNNICVATDVMVTETTDSGILPAAKVESDYNVFYNLSHNELKSHATWRTLASWQETYGQDRHSLTDDPKLSASYVPISGSSASQLGANLSSLCTEYTALCKDKAGRTRPASGNWDSGAYNSSNLPNSSAVSPPSNLTAIGQ